MIREQILNRDFYESYLGSPEFTSSFFANNTRLRGDRDVALYFSRYAVSTEMQHDLLGSSRDLNLRSNVDLTFQEYHTCVSMHLDERNIMVSE